MEEYYGPNVSAQQQVNKILNLASSGREQDWELEFADCSRISEMLNIYKKGVYADDVRCALAFLIVSSLLNSDSAVPEYRITDATSAIRVDEYSLSRIEFFLKRAGGWGTAFDFERLFGERQSRS